MKKRRLNYLLIVCVIILLGILSRTTPIIPLFVGDILYAVMVFYGIKMIFMGMSSSKNLLFSLLLCFLIEFSQLYQSAWINQIRATFLGKSILGQGFLWIDLVCYILGVSIAFWIEQRFSKQS